MKKLYLLIIIGLLWSIRVNASDTFYEGSYISGEYINRVIDNKTYYMTMQYIKDDKGDIVYCLEPFVSFSEGKLYTKYEGDLTGYKELTEKQKRNIELIIYYGYGYGSRTSSKWYVVTQYLVWKEVAPKANIYFTNKLNGSKITKYEDEMKMILNDVSNHDIKPSFVKDYIVNYKDSLLIENLNSNYAINTYYEYELDNGFKVHNIIDDGVISIELKSNYYKNKVAIYDSTNSQDLIRPGNVSNTKYNINVKVNKGDITLDIRDDDSVYTIESDFSDTCYEIRDDNKVIDKVCTFFDELVYKTDYLPFGEYEIVQVSNGLGYKKDKNVYKVTIDSNNMNPIIVLNNRLIRNKINIIKYACYYDDCEVEKDALFRVTDRAGNLVADVSSDSLGLANIEVGYGTYNVEQVKGLESYSLSSPYIVKIVDEDTLHKKELFNYYIEDEKIEEIEDEMIPDTMVDFSIIDIIVGIIKDILVFIKI